MNSFPVRIFHALVSGAVLAVVMCALIYRFQQSAYADTGLAAFRGNGSSTPISPNQTTPIGNYPSTTNDLDGDGIPNSWETEHQHNPENAADAAYDFDFDGLTAKQEYDLSVRTNGAYGNPLGNFKLLSIPPPPGFKTNAAGQPLITTSGFELIESAKNGTSLFRITGIATGQSTTSTRTFTYSPITQSWALVTPPDGYSSAVLYPTDINSKGQVVGSFYSGSYKGFCWTPDTSAAGGSSQQFFLNTSPQTSALPRRISDTGYLLYSTPSSGILKAADPKRRPVNPIYNPWVTPEYVDVNDFGEFVGTILDPVTWQNITFLAILDGPTFLTSMTRGNSRFYGESAYFGVDYPSQINWVDVYCYDVDGYEIFPGDVPYFLDGEVFDSEGNPIDPTTFSAYQYGTASGSTTQFRRLWGSSEIWRSDGLDTWEFFYSSTVPTAVLNDWGEFAGQYSETSITQTGEYGTNTYESSGSFFYDGSYSLFDLPVVGMSNDPQALLRTGVDRFSLASNNIICPLENLQTSEILRPINAKLCDNGLIVLQTQPKTFKILIPDDDSDGDGMPDDWEKNYYFDPASNDANSDIDGDGTNNYGEYLLRTDPTQAPILGANGEEIDTRPGIDTDADGIPNSWECTNGLNYADPSDAPLDFDRDGYTNLQEFRLNTDPRGAPSYRIRKIGPFPDTSSVGMSPNKLGDGAPSSLNGSGGLESLFFAAQPSTSANGGRRPAVWNVSPISDQGTMSYYPTHGSQQTYPLAWSATGAAITENAGGTRVFTYWASPSTSPVQLSGASNANNISNIRNVRFSPSGNYLVGCRYLASNPSIYQPIIWKMPLPGGQTFTPVALTPPTSENVSLSATDSIYVNDAGYVTATCLKGSDSRGILWKTSDTGSIESTTILPPLPGGTWSRVTGISNNSDPFVAGNSTITGGQQRATVWSVSGTPKDLGAMGGNYSSIDLITPSGIIAGQVRTYIDGTLKFQPYTASLITASGASQSTWQLEIQSDPGASFNLRALNESGELIGISYRTVPVSATVQTLWRHGQAFPIESTVRNSPEYSLDAITSLNPNGTLLATARKDGASVTILLTPDCDTDNDGLPDAYENRYGFNAFSKNNVSTDSDTDGLTDLEEFRNGTDPRNPDSDSDAMKDGFEVSWGLLPLDPSDSQLDPDNDHVTNVRESQIGTIPTGIYKVENRFTDIASIHPNVTAADDIGQLVRNGATTGIPEFTQGSSEFTQEFFFLPDETASQPEGSIQLPSYTISGWMVGDWESWYFQCNSPHYFPEPVAGKINAEILRWTESFDGTDFQYVESFFLIPDLVSHTDESEWIPWSNIENRLRDPDLHDGAAPLGSDDALSNYSDAVSPSGVRRVHRNYYGESIVLNERGDFVEKFQGQETWQLINDEGTAVRITGYNSSVLVLSTGENITIPEVPGLPSEFNLISFSNDGMALLSKAVSNEQFAFSTQYFLLDTELETLTRVRQPSLGSESVTALSATNSRLLGNGPKPFQITPDGTCIRLEALRIKNGPTDAALPLSDPSLYPRPLTPNRIASSGLITLTTVNSANQQVILQITPFNDIDNNGLPDDWEKSNGIVNPGGTTDSDGDGLTNAEEIVLGTNPFSADTDGDGIPDNLDPDPLVAQVATTVAAFRVLSVLE